jgi:hypothetical protein
MHFAAESAGAADVGAEFRRNATKFDRGARGDR